MKHVILQFKSREFKCNLDEQQISVLAGLIILILNSNFYRTFLY